MTTGIALTSPKQALVAKAQEIALRYPRNEVRRYQDAADVLRLPFWDWAAMSDMPAVTAGQTVSIRTSSGNVEEVANPLYDFDYPTAAESGQFGPYDGGDRTRRCTSGQANIVLATSGLTAQVVRDDSTACCRPLRPDGRSFFVNYANCRGQYNVFVRATDYQTMASQQSSGSSFESPHNTVHMRSSCGGDLGNPNVAAFDPIL